MVLGRAIESYGDGTGQVKKAGGIGHPKTDCRRYSMTSGQNVQWAVLHSYH